jgi:hypothetical protein
MTVNRAHQQVRVRVFREGFDPALSNLDILVVDQLTI